MKGYVFEYIFFSLLNVVVEVNCEFVLISLNFCVGSQKVHVNVDKRTHQSLSELSPSNIAGWLHIVRSLYQTRESAVNKG